MKLSVASILFFSAASVSAQSSDLCLPDCSSGRCIFELSVDLTAGQTGYFMVEGCEGVNPTLGVEMGVSHTFIQREFTNWYHALGLAYAADGALLDNPELEPCVAPPGTGNECEDTCTCPAPMYFKNGVYLGEFSNDEDILPVTEGVDNFGLDDYEPLFFYPFGQWLEEGLFSVNLKFTEDFNRDIFYFCHIHQGMTGRIKLLRDGVPVSEGDVPEIPYEYDVPSRFDALCGNFGLDGNRLPDDQCPETFVCLADGAPADLGLFADCVNAQDCSMFKGMTSGVSATGGETALFLHQMIPHHENAVNMAKTLLELGNLDCDNYDDEDADCIMYEVALSIVDVQNFQIQTMRSLLDAFGYPETDDCVVSVDA